VASVGSSRFITRSVGFGKVGEYCFGSLRRMLEWVIEAGNIELDFFVLQCGKSEILRTTISLYSKEVPISSPMMMYDTKFTTSMSFLKVGLSAVGNIAVRDAA
jgi:hypothetical protein